MPSWGRGVMLWAMITLLLALACAKDTPSDGVDDTSDTSVEEGPDSDGDGVPDAQDCAPDDPAKYPGAEELCDGLDSDCDGSPAWGESDENGDGVMDCEPCSEAGFWDEMKGANNPASKVPGLLTEDACTSQDYSYATKWMFERLDPVDDLVECVYTGRMVSVADGKPEGDDMNTEHTWPQSQGASDYPARCDLHHLFPTDSYANNRRGSFPLGVVDGSGDWSEGGSKVGEDASGVEVFEPRDEHKGDAARAMLYMQDRYGADLWGNEALFLSWAAQDPPSALDIERSLKIADYQAQANPWVVCPLVPPQD